MLLSFVMLHSHSVGCIVGFYLHNIIAIDIEQHTLSTIEAWFTPKHCKPLDPIQCVVTMHLESLEGNCVDTFSEPFTYKINTSITYSISQQNFTK